MNKQRRADIEKAIALLNDAKAALEAARDEEQDYYDNMPEAFQNGDKGSNAQEAIDGLDEAVCSIDDAIGHAEGAMEK